MAFYSLYLYLTPIKTARVLVGSAVLVVLKSFITFLKNITTFANLNVKCGLPCDIPRTVYQLGYLPSMNVQNGTR